MSHDDAVPGLLVVEDDAVSRSFLVDALAALPARVDAAADIAQAVALAGRTTHCLWLVDAHLPDGDGIQCLRALRALADTPALAITAGAPRDELDALCDSGFVEVLLKPVSVALLQGTVRRLIGQPGPGIREPLPGKLPVWDQARALAAIGGNTVALAALRKLFLDELPGMQAQLGQAHAAGDAAAMRAILHKLKASCGFVGAARLARAVDALGVHPLDPGAWQWFEFAAADAIDWREPEF